MALYPVGMPSTNTIEAHLNTVYYTKIALDQLWKKFVYRSIFEKYDLPANSGLSVQMHRYSNFVPSLTPTTEGDVGNSLTLSSRAIRCGVSHFSSFLTVSDLHQATAPDDQIAAASRNLGYRAGYSVDNLHRGVIDDQAPNCTQALLGPTYTLADSRAATKLLQGLDVQPAEDGLFTQFMHPYVSFDLINDPSTNGLADLTKYNQDVKSSPLNKLEDRGTVLVGYGVKIMETTSVFTQTVSSINYYRTYIFGKGALGCVDLAGFAPSEVMDPKKQNFNIKTWRAGNGNTGFDPVGVLAGWASYKFVTGATWLDGPEGIGGTFRARVLDAPSTIA